MKFGIDNCAVLELERGRLVRSEGIELPDGERMKEVDQERYKYLGVLQLQPFTEIIETNAKNGLVALAHKQCKDNIIIYIYKDLRLGWLPSVQSSVWFSF